MAPLSQAGKGTPAGDAEQGKVATHLADLMAVRPAGLMTASGQLHGHLRAVSRGRRHGGPPGAPAPSRSCSSVGQAGSPIKLSSTAHCRLYRLRIVQLPPSPPGAWWRRCAIGFAEPGPSARSHDRAAIGKTKQSAYSGKSCSPAGSPQLVHPRVSDLGDSLGVGPTLAGARIGIYRCRERADRPLPVVCGGGNLDARPVGRQRNDHRAVP